MLIIQCPSCLSENVTNLSFDSNDFICNDCGEDFEADNGVVLEEDDDIDEDENENASFIDLPPELAKNIANQLKNKNSENPDANTTE